MSKGKTKPKEVQRNTNTNKKTKRLYQTKDPTTRLWNYSNMILLR